MKLKILFCVLLISLVSIGQTNIIAGGTYTQDFNALGASSTASLPANWKAQKTTTVRDASLTYVSAAVAVERQAGNAMSSSAANGIYRYDANDATTESALGGLSSSTSSKTVAFMSYFKNNASTAISGFTISYTVEKYRNGSNTAGFTIDLLYSTDGVNWTVCGASFVTSFTADVDNNGYTTAPTSSTTVSGTYTPASSIAQNETFYFAWRYSVTTGSTTSNAQGLGFDNVSITAIATTPPAITLTDNGSQITASTVAQGTANHILTTFKTTVANSTATLSSATFTISGSYQTTDLVANSFKLWYNTTTDFATATPIGSPINATANGSGETLNFSSLAQSIPVGTGYFWLTTAINENATAGNTINCNAVLNTNLTFTSGTISGSASAAGVQTIVLTAPNVPTNFTEGCTTNTSQELSWSPPASGSFDGYLLVVRQGATPNAVTSIVASSQSFVLDYATAPVYNATTSKVLYIGTANSVTVTGLTAGLNYTFALYAYKNNGSTSLYSAPTTTSQTIQVINASNANATAGNTTAITSWLNPSCFDEVMAVVTSSAGITFTPSGNGSSYIPNPVFSGFNQVVYAGTGNNFSITGLTNGTTYYIEIFIRIGSDWSSGIEVSVTPNVSTIFKPGELVFVGFDGQVNGSGANDQYLIATMVDIMPGTTFSLVNSRYEAGAAANVRTNKWGGAGNFAEDAPGVVEITYKSSETTPIPSGSVLVLTTNSSATVFSYIGIITGTTETDRTASFDRFLPFGNATEPNISTSGSDQLYLIQGYFTDDGNIDTNEANYILNGTLLHGLTNRVAWVSLSSACNGNDSGGNSRESRLPAALTCFNVESASSTSVSGYFENDKEHGLASLRNIILAIADVTNNWTFSSGRYSLDPSSNLATKAGKTFLIGAGNQAGQWIGSVDTNWFNCSNWEALKVPDASTDVFLNANSIQKAVVSSAAVYASIYNGIATCKNLNIDEEKVEIVSSDSNILVVYGNLLIDTNGSLDMNGGGAIDGQIKLYGNWTNNVGNNDFDEGKGTVTFTGSNPQLINNVSPLGTEVFYNVVLNNDFDTAVSNDLVAEGNLDVNTTKNVSIDSNGYISVKKALNHNGNLVIENNGQFIQVDETDSNTGTYTGTTFQVNRIAQASNLDYVYWSSPLENFAVSNLPNSHRYEWSATAINPNNTQGNWLPASGIMSKGNGYIARASNGAATPINLPVLFQGGKPNNGQFNYTIARGSTLGTDDCWNLIGNPYPSALDADLFLAYNLAIEGSVRIWMHGTSPAVIPSPFYENFLYNYTENDYIVYNGTATSIPAVFDGKIASGQGFFVRMLEDGETDVLPPTSTTTAATGTITFKNEFRRAIDSSILENSQFYRNTTTIVSEKSRIWLDLIASNNQTSRTVIGYVPGATLAKDRLYDALIEVNSFKLYSLIDTQKQTIQGRPVPFDATDEVPLGFYIETAGNYTIAIATVDGLFESTSQSIYIEDKLLHIIHDVRQAPYTFSSLAGEFNDRFVLRYTTSVLDNSTFENTSDLVIITNETITLHASENIKSVEVFDVLSKKIYEKDSIHSTEVALDKLKPATEVLVVKTTFDNGKIITQKIIY